MNVAGLVLIGSARLRRRHFKSRSLVNSYRAGAHCDLVTHDVSALFSDVALKEGPECVSLCFYDLAFIGKLYIYIRTTAYSLKK